MAIARDQVSPLVTQSYAGPVTVTWAVNPAAGAKVLIFIRYFANASFTVVDNGTTPTQFAQDNISYAGSDTWIYRADNITLPAAGSYAVTITSTVSGFRIACGGVSYTGVKPGAPTGINVAQGTSNAPASGGVNPIAAGALYFAVFSDLSALIPETVTLNWAGATQQFVVTGSAGYPCAAADLIGSGAQYPAWTLGDSPAWGAIAVVYDVAGTVVPVSSRTEVPWQFSPHAAPGEPFDPGANTWRTLPPVPAGPVLTASYLVADDTADQVPLTSPSFSPLPGEVIIVKAWTTAPQQFGSPSDSAGACAYQQLASAATPGFGVTSIWAASVGSPTLNLPPPPVMSVTVPVTGGNSPHGMVVERWAGAMVAQKTGLVGYSGTVDSEQGTGSPSANSMVPATHNSVLTWLNADVNAVDGTARSYIFGVGGGAETGYHRVAGSCTAYSAYQYPYAKAVAESYGLTAPGGQQWQALAVELEQLTVPSWNPPGPYSLSFYDDFPGNALNRLKWQPGWYGDVITGPVNASETAVYNVTHVTVGGGNLQLLLDATTSDGGAHPNTGALIATHGQVNAQDGLFDFQYGYLEFRASIPGSSGHVWNWPALWATGYGQWPNTGEIDVFEGLGGSASFNMHSSQGQLGPIHPPGDYSGWHTFGVAWLPNRIDWYFDGVLTGSALPTSSVLITNSPMFVVIDNTVAANVPNVLPSTLLVDWIRIWSVTGPQPPSGTQAVPWQFSPHAAPGEPFTPWLPFDYDSPVTAAAGTATLAGTGSLSAPAVQQAPATLTGAGSLAAPAAQQAPAALAAAGSLTAAPVQQAPAALAGTGSLTGAAVQAASAALAAAGSLGAPPVIQAATAALGGAGSLTAAATESAPAALAGTGSLTAPAVQGAPATLTGTGSITGQPTTAGSGAATLAAAGSLTAAAVQLAPATLAGAGSLTAAAVQQAPATLTGTGSLTAAATERAPAALAGTGSLAAPGAQLAPATLPGAGSLTGTGAVSATATLPGTGSLAGTWTVRVPATLAGAGSLTALAIQQATALLAAAGSLTAAGVSRAAVVNATSAPLVTASVTSGAAVTSGTTSSPAVTPAATSAPAVSDG